MSCLWGGRFNHTTNQILNNLNSSIEIDKKLWEYDIKGSKAYANCLKDANIITEVDNQGIQTGLDTIFDEWVNGSFIIKTSDEDIHTAHERRLKELIGAEIGGKLHTGRSRNDQVTTDVKLYINNVIGPNLLDSLCTLCYNLLVKAEKLLYISDLSATNPPDLKEFNGDLNNTNNKRLLMIPGYTHLQRAQPVLFSHWILSYAWAFYRDTAKLDTILNNQPWGLTTLTLGSGAIAGNPFNIDRQSLASNLGFTHCSMNSMDATGDRDFIIDLLYWSALVSVHLSRLSEDLILYSSKEFGYIELAQELCTGSSLMPQKKNPDSLEIIRGKAGTIIGNCNAMLIVAKGLPSTYNKDLQDDKKLLFDSCETTDICVRLMAAIIDTFEVNYEACQKALSPDMLATDIAYYLVRKGVPFRDAHHCAGKVVSYAESINSPLDKLKLEDYKRISSQFDADILDIWDYERSVEQYSAIGGTSSQNVKSQIDYLKSWLRKYLKI